MRSSATCRHVPEKFYSFGRFDQQENYNKNELHNLDNIIATYMYPDIFHIIRVNCAKSFLSQFHAMLILTSLLAKLPV